MGQPCAIKGPPDPAQTADNPPGEDDDDDDEISNICCQSKQQHAEYFSTR